MPSRPRPDAARGAGYTIRGKTGYNCRFSAASSADLPWRRLCEPHPRAPRPRAARARPRHPAAVSPTEATTRRRGQHRRRSDGAGQDRAGADFPDLVLTSTDRGHKLMGTVEVETAESVNHLEAMAQWAHLGRARAPSILCAGRVGGHRAAAGRREPGERRRNLELSHDRRSDPVHAGAPRPRTASRGAPRHQLKRLARGEAGRAPRRDAKPAAAQDGRASRPRSQGARPEEQLRRARRKGSSPAVPEVQPRQARLREHVRRPQRSAPRQVAHAASFIGFARRPA